MRRELIFLAALQTVLGASAPLAGVPLFDYEKTQLTDRALAQLSAEHQVYFGFDDSAVNSILVPRKGECKVWPTDDDFPRPHIWEDFNVNTFVKGAMIYPAPIASPCYLNWGNWDKAKCEKIVRQWTNPYLQ
jgi:hypothetical protein